MNWTMNYGHLIEVRFWSCVQKGVRTKTDIFDGTFCENSQGLKFFDIFKIQQARENSLIEVGH